MVFGALTNLLKNHFHITAIPYMVSAGPEQGFPCVVFPHREKPVLSSWDPYNENRIFPVGNTTSTGKTLFSLQGWICSDAEILEVFLL